MAIWLLLFLILFTTPTSLYGQDSSDQVNTPQGSLEEHDDDWYWLIFPIIGLIVLSLIIRLRRRKLVLE